MKVMPDKPTLDNMPEEIRQLSQEVAQIKQMIQELNEEKNQKANEETWMSVPETAKLTGFAEQTIRTLVMNNKIPSHKVEGKRMFLKSEIIEWMKNSKT
jgi:excisionase family DNA binding protein